MDYMKIVDLVARILGSEHNDLKARHDGVDIVEITMTLTGGSTLAYKMFPSRYETAMTFSKKSLSPEQFKRLVSKLEFEAEQAFMKNVRVTHADELAPDAWASSERSERPAEYKIKLAL